MQCGLTGPTCPGGRERGRDVGVQSLCQLWEANGRGSSRVPNGLSGMVGLHQPSAQGIPLMLSAALDADRGLCFVVKIETWNSTIEGGTVDLGWASLYRSLANTCRCMLSKPGADVSCSRARV